MGQKRELLMLRHGVTEANERRVFTGGSDIPLSEGGRAKLAPLYGTFPEATLFFTSGMLRARQTLQLLYGDVPEESLPDLSEYLFGEFEGRHYDDLSENEPIFREWMNLTRDDIACPGGESRRMFDERVTRGFVSLLSRDWSGLAVLVSHGGVLAGIMRLFVLSGAWIQPPDNASGWWLWISEDGKITRYEAFP